MAAGRQGMVEIQLAVDMSRGKVVYAGCDLRRCLDSATLQGAAVGLLLVVFLLRCYLHLLAARPFWPCALLTAS